MSGLKQVTARAAVLDIANIDTDQIIPARFLTTTKREGLGRHAFNDWRYDVSGAPTEGFVLNRPENTGDLVLLAGDNFGCGSSREHAPWALLDSGIRAVISTRIADIFRNNALKNGLLAIVVTPEQWAALANARGSDITVDLLAQEIRTQDTTVPFTVDAFARACLLDGVDELGYLQQRESLIAQYERRNAA